MTESVHDAVLEFTYDDTDSARIVERSVGQEIGEIAGDRTTADIARDGTTVAVTVTAADLVALRAGINTWTTLVSVAERAVGTVSV